MTILITGSEGYVGTALQEKLRAVYPDCSIARIDRIFRLEVTSIANLAHIDYVIHLAAQPSVFNSDIDQVINDNFKSFEHICDLAKYFNVPFIYASSAVAYEKNISSVYGESKKANELYAKENYPSAVGLRFHNIYSKSPRKDTIFSRLLSDDEVTLVNNGLIKRHFTLLDDIVGAIIYTVEQYKSLKGVYNVLNPFENSILELANEVKIYRPELKINLSPELLGRDTVYQYIDNSLDTIPIKYRDIHEGVRSIFNN